MMMLKLAEMAVFPLIITCAGLVEKFWEHPIAFFAAFFCTILCCMVLATKEDE